MPDESTSSERLLETWCPASGSSGVLDAPATILTCLETEDSTETRIMHLDPAAGAAEVPCPACGSLLAELTPAKASKFRCLVCGRGFDAPRIGLG